MTKSQIVTLLTSSIGSIGAGLGGTYALTKKDIKNFLTTDLLDTNKNEEDWKALHNSLKSGDISSQNKQLKTIKESNVTDGSELSQWCEQQSKNKFSSLFKFNEELNLIKDIKNYCIRTFKSKIGNVFDVEGETDKSAIEQKINLLKQHNDSNNGNIDSHEKLKSIKEKALKPENQENLWKELREECKKMYEKGFTKEEENNDWKLAKHYCSK